MHAKAERNLKEVVSTHLRNFDLTRLEWLVLATCCEKKHELPGGHTMGDISRVLDIKLSQCTQLVDSLQRGKLVMQMPFKDDKRIRLVTATAKGLRVHRETEDTMRQAMKQWLKGIPRDRLAIYLQTVDLLGE